MLGWLRKKPKAEASEPARTPDAMRVYAVGDIHGRADLVAQLQRKIELDAAEHPEKDMHLIYLGDYIDRGPESRAVLERLSTQPPAGLNTHFLMGNHEQAMLTFLAEPAGYAQWLEYGGLATVESYLSDRGPVDLSDLMELGAMLSDAVPAHQLEFLRNLELYLCLGDYLFVHAGLRPGVPLEDQQPDDLLWIRGEFLRSDSPHPYVVVHGHHVGDTIDVRANRICVDTGAYATGCLSCLILDGTERFRMDTLEGGPVPLVEETSADA